MKWIFISIAWANEEEYIGTVSDLLHVVFEYVMLLYFGERRGLIFGLHSIGCYTEVRSGEYAYACADERTVCSWCTSTYRGTLGP